MTRTMCAFAVLGMTAPVNVGCGRTDSREVESTTHPSGGVQTVRSPDDTRIGFTIVGSGPVPVVIVHGALNSGEQWTPVAPAMAQQCTCYVMDRWGRGGSETRTAYSLEREVEDIGAVLEVAGVDAYLLGHSSGAISMRSKPRVVSL